MYKAIIIDDEKLVVKSLIATIRNQDYFEIEAEFYDGISGLNYIRENAPPLAFVDVQLPGMTGLEILEHASQERIPTLFVVISGYAEFSYAQQAIRHNAIGYCLKPFSRTELLEIMKKAVEILEERAAADAMNRETGDESFLPKAISVHNRTVQTMLDYTRQHYCEEISIQTLAELCSINPNYTSQLFRQELGQTFSSYLTGLRMDHSIFLLTRTDMAVSQIANTVGYQDYFYFAKVF